jgi:hypothetical protein
MADVIDVTARVVEVALVTNVEDAMSENGLVAVSHRPVDVAFTATPLYVSGVQAKAAPLPSLSVPQEKIPVVDAFTSQSAALSPETTRSVVEAVPETVSAVEDAYGAVKSAADGIVMDPMLLIVVVAVPPKYAVPKLERSVVEACAKRTFEVVKTFWSMS